MSRGIRVMIVAGEVSGDMHAAGVLRALKSRYPSVTVFGIGGDNLRSLGMEIFYDVRQMAVIGFVELLPKMGFFIRVFRRMKQLAVERKPDAVVLVDYPGFNLRFASWAHAHGLKVIYYICPQVWAWNRSRIPGMARVIDRLITIFPFEPAIFEDTDLRVDYAGHPLVEKVQARPGDTESGVFRKGQPRIAVLPGSRRQEIVRMLPAFRAACDRILESEPGASFVVASPTPAAAEVARLCAPGLFTESSPWAIVTGQTGAVLRQARAAFVASGTATLETALAKCPMVIAYKVSPLSYHMLRRAVTVDHIGMVNIVAGRMLCPELIQHDAVPDRLAEALLPLLGETEERRVMLLGFDEVEEKLGPAGSYDRAAAMILEELDVTR
jgi:lipid-A-disaccharide synthase